MVCASVNEPSEPAEHGWSDNFLCASEDVGLSFRADFPVRDQYCINLHEPLDPHTWGDNYLCSPQNLGLAWSHEGPIPGMSCLPITEPMDPDWLDNFVCWNP
jgi:hypothetical protein